MDSCSIRCRQEPGNLANKKNMSGRLVNNPSSPNEEEEALNFTHISKTLKFSNKYFQLNRNIFASPKASRNNRLTFAISVAPPATSSESGG